MARSSRLCTWLATQDSLSTQPLLRCDRCLTRPSQCASPGDTNSQQTGQSLVTGQSNNSLFAGLLAHDYYPLMHGPPALSSVSSLWPWQYRRPAALTGADLTKLGRKLSRLRGELHTQFTRARTHSEQPPQRSARECLQESAPKLPHQANGIGGDGSSPSCGEAVR